MGEKLAVRGIGLDEVPGCFVCGAIWRDEAARKARNSYLSNISAFVKTKEVGEKIVAMFPRGARLDFRPTEPDWIQVKIGACSAHYLLLDRLMRMMVMRDEIDAETVKEIIEG